MSEVAVVAFGAVPSTLLIMFTKLGLVKIGQNVQLLLGLKTLLIHRSLPELRRWQAH